MPRTTGVRNQFNRSGEEPHAKATLPKPSQAQR